MSRDLYREFASVYHLFFRRTDHFDPDYVAFFKKILQKYRVRTVLDCACGIGRDLLLLQRLGVKAQGTDLSPSMLRMARRNLENAGQKVPLRRMDFRELHLRFSPVFDAVVCLNTSVPHLPDCREVLKAIRSMYRVISPHGILIITQGISDRMMREKIRFVPEKITDEFCRVMVLDYERNRVAVHVLDFEPSKGRRSFRSYTFRYLALGKPDYVRLLKRAGFSRILCYGDYRFTPYDEEESGRLVIVAEKG